MSDTYFVKIDKPSEVQRTILLTSKAFLSITKSQLALKTYAQQKVELKEQIKQTLEVIANLVVRLQERLPHGHLLSEFNREEIKPVVIPHKVTPESHARSDVQKLNDAIAKIEERLARLK